MLLLSNNKPLRVLGKSAVSTEIVEWISRENIVSVTAIYFENAVVDPDFAQYQYLVGVARDMPLRLKIINWLTDNNLNTPAYVHPFSDVDDLAAVSPGTVITQGAVVGRHTVMGPHCYISPMCLVSHKVQLGTSVMLRPYASILGGTKIANYADIEAQAMISDNLVISAEWVRILPTSFVSKNIDITGTYGGTPARRISQKSSFISHANN